MRLGSGMEWVTSMSFDDDLARRGAIANARLAAAGLCIMHNADVAPPAEYLMELPIGNVVPLCAPCCAWWRLNAKETGEPASQPVSIRDYRPEEWQ